jgi:hypothetical protein
MAYTTYLSRVESEDEPLLYQGPLTFTGSNTGYLEGAGDVSSVSLVMRGGKLVFYAHGVNDSGQAVSFPFLQNGRMESLRHLEGTFDLPGALSGSWQATR